jgi:nucleotide-binding universal stress UspA family protein
MYQKILIATDGSELSEKAADAGIELAALSGGELLALQVVPRYPVSYFEGGINLQDADVEQVERKWAEAAQQHVQAVEARASARRVKAKGLTIHADLVAEAIIAVAEKHHCDLIIMASHGRRGITRLLLGSETTHVLTHSRIPVMVLR